MKLRASENQREREQKIKWDGGTERERDKKIIKARKKEKMSERGM